ncbi:MAG: endopeptidase La [Pirellulales bacterium]
MSDGDRTFSLPVLPLKNTVLFPNLVLPLVVGRPSSLAAVEAALKSEDKTLVLVAQKDATVEDPQPDGLYTIGTQAVIKKMDRAEGQVQLVVQGSQRLELVSVTLQDGLLQAQVRPIAAPEDTGPEVEALQRLVLEQASKIHALVQPQTPISVEQFMSQFSDPLHQAYLLGSMLSIDLEKEQALLEAPTRVAALRLMHEYLTHEVQVLELRQEIANEARTEMSREQREYLLRQQMQAIQQELGEQSPEQAEAAELRRRFEEADLPENVRKEAARDLARLERMPPAAPDYQLTRTYLELVLELPWSNATDDSLDLARARQVLDEDHYGLKEIKERILEHLAVLKLNPKAKAPILCFVGPPGVGKTSLGKSIARALGRNFERISLGGLHDESELRGHRRTYIGAMPGRIIQAIRRAGVNNPLLMLDEVDKLGQGFHGDPAAALLEILDPAQNFEFRDNYLNLAFDLSRVFFVTTANTLDTIPRPLLDRMEMLRLAGYTSEEKFQIARRYLIPRQLSEAGLTAEQLNITDDTLEQVITRYTREAGVRQLERALGSLTRKIAVRFAEGQTDAVSVEPDDLKELLGPEKFFPEAARTKLPPGVSTGLAWTETGGEVLYVEALLLPDGKGLTLTGQLGDVMRESAQAAHSYVWSRAAELEIDEHKFKDFGLHVHVPAGAVPKDGPSAGVAMVTALASLYTGLPVRRDTAMTGEITLSGLVLPVGGIKEKVLAARRAGVSRVILPKQNEQDLADVPPDARGELEFVFAERVDDAWAAAIPQLADRLAEAEAA